MVAVASMSDELRSLIGGLRQLGVTRVEAVAPRLLEFGTLVLEANHRTNLVGGGSLEDLVSRHLLDSLALPPWVSLKSPVIDVGSGAGFPGIPLALVHPKIDFALFEPRAKRFEFLKVAISALGLSNVAVYKTTAETAGRDRWRASAETVTVRALAKPPVLLELGLPLLAKGGQLIAYQGRQNRPSAPETRIAHLLGGRFAEASAVTVPYLDAARNIWVFRKVSDTPRRFPRSSGIPAKEPLLPQ
jgi:16S rRNA (guanine527-N7)-methyltransferase